MLDILEQVINKVSISSRDFLDIRYAYAEGESFTARNDRFDSVSNQTIGGIAVRALIDNAWGFTSTIKTDVESINKTVNRAISMARIGGKYTENQRCISDKWVFEGKGEMKLKIDPRDIDKETKFEKISQIEKAARNFSEKIVEASSTYQESHSKEIIVNNKGTRVENENHVIRLMKAVIGREGTQIQNVFDSIGGAISRSYHCTSYSR